MARYECFRIVGDADQLAPEGDDLQLSVGERFYILGYFFQSFRISIQIHI